MKAISRSLANLGSAKEVTQGTIAGQVTDNPGQPSFTQVCVAPKLCKPLAAD